MLKFIRKNQSVSTIFADFTICNKFTGQNQLVRTLSDNFPRPLRFHCKNEKT